jgi:hypothetical protein
MLSKVNYSMISIQMIQSYPIHINDLDLKSKEIFPKLERLAFCDGRVYILFESASNRFIYGKLIKANYVYSYDVR